MLLFYYRTLKIAALEHRGTDDSYQVTGDVWMIGNLINDQKIRFDLSESARNFLGRLIC